MDTLYINATEKLMQLYQPLRAVRSGAENLPGVASRPDSIAEGSLGQYFFVLELYKSTGDETLLADVRTYLNDMRDYVRNNKSSNYSLFKGRTGVALLSLEIYKCTKEETFLSFALELTDLYWNRNTLSLRFFDKSGVVDGAAGILLFYLLLHAETGKPELLKYMEACIMSLIGKAQVTADGIYWSKNVFDDDTAVMWPRDNAGVAFAILEAGRYLNNQDLVDLAVSALRFEGDKVPGALTTPGNSLVELYAAGYTGNSHCADSWDLLAANPEALILQSDNDGVGNGLAGWALAFREAYRLTGRKNYHEAASRLSMALWDKIDSGLLTAETDTHFFYGLAGIGYALLKVGDKAMEPSLILPAVQGTGSSQPLLEIDRRAVNKLLMQFSFVDTLALLRKQFPTELEAFLSAGSFVTVPGLSQWVSGLSEETSSDREDSIAESLEREVLCQALKRNPGTFKVNSNTAFAARAEEMLLMTDEALVASRLKLTSDYFLLMREEPVDFSQPLTADLLAKILTTYGAKSYFIRLNRFNEVEKGRLFIGRLYIEEFKAPVVVGDVVAKILAYVESQDGVLLASIQESMEAESTEQLREMLTAALLESVKWSLVLGILDVA